MRVITCWRSTSGLIVRFTRTAVVGAGDGGWAEVVATDVVSESMTGPISRDHVIYLLLPRKVVDAIIVYTTMPVQASTPQRSSAMTGCGSPSHVKRYVFARRTLVTSAGLKQARQVPPARRVLGYTTPSEPASSRRSASACDAT